MHDMTAKYWATVEPTAGKYKGVRVPLVNVSLTSINAVLDPPHRVPDPKPEGNIKRTHNPRRAGKE